MVRPKRNKDVRACPNAEQWMQKHPEAASNMRRIIEFMNGLYQGDYQGYINRDTNFVEYRFDPIEGEHRFQHVQLFGRQKHVVVRFTLFAKPTKKYSGISKTLKNQYGNDYYVLEFPMAIETNFDKLETFLGTTVTFSSPEGSLSLPRGSARYKSHKQKARRAIDRAEQGAAQELAEPITSEYDARKRELRAVFFAPRTGRIQERPA